MSLLGNLSVVSGATLVSRILGLLRDILFFATFGATIYGEVFLLAFTIPNLFRRLLGEGTLTSSFVPVFSNLLFSKKKSISDELINKVFTRLVIFLGILSVSICFISWLAFEAEFFSEKKWHLASLLNCVIFPYVLFICLASILVGALNVHGKFIEGAISPVLLNGVLIIVLSVGLFSETKNLKTFVIFLSLSVVCAGFLQFLIPWFSMKKVFHWNWAFDTKSNEHFQKVSSLFWVGALGAGVAQINILFSRLFAYSLDDIGGVSFLYMSSRLVELPLGLFAIALTTVLFPRLTKASHTNDSKDFNASFFLGLRVIAAFSIPASCGLFFLPSLVIGVLFEWNQFGASEVQMASKILQISAWTIPAYALSTFLVKAHHSRKNMRSPLHAALISLIFNIAGCLFLAGTMGVEGLALANLMAAFAQTIFLSFTSKNLSLHSKN